MGAVNQARLLRKVMRQPAAASAVAERRRRHRRRRRRTLRLQLQRRRCAQEGWVHGGSRPGLEWGSGGQAAAAAAVPGAASLPPGQPAESRDPPGSRRRRPLRRRCHPWGCHRRRVGCHAVALASRSHRRYRWSLEKARVWRAAAPGKRPLPPPPRSPPPAARCRWAGVSAAEARTVAARCARNATGDGAPAPCPPAAAPRRRQRLAKWAARPAPPREESPGSTWSRRARRGTLGERRSSRQGRSG